MDEKIKLTCEICGTIYEKPKSYKDLNNVYFKWNLKYCDKCRREKELEALKYIPEVLKVLKNKEE